MELELTDGEKRTLLLVARAAIAARLGEPAPQPPAPTGALLTPCGAFVTLRTAAGLRGCIGFISAAKPLAQTVKDVAVSSAFEDPRFPPVQRSELAGLSIEISVLSPLRRITDPREIAVGVHGVLIKRGFRSGLLLPQVATEQGWDRETFLAHTCRKAGLPMDARKSPDASLEIFSALVFHEEE
jgi:AmmeMemoRadiSam system protein A